MKTHSRATSAFVRVIYTTRTQQAYPSNANTQKHAISECECILSRSLLSRSMMARVMSLMSLMSLPTHAATRTCDRVFGPSPCSVLCIFGLVHHQPPATARLHGPRHAPTKDRPCGLSTQACMQGIRTGIRGIHLYLRALSSLLASANVSPAGILMFRASSCIFW